MRHHKVLVRFTGESMIGSAVQDLVIETLKPNRPLLAIVRRAFGDKTVAQGKLQELTVATNEAQGTTKVDVATGDIEVIDLPIAPAPHLAKLEAQTKGKRLQFAFAGKAKPDGALRATMTKSLQHAGPCVRQSASACCSIANWPNACVARVPAKP